MTDVVMSGSSLVETQPRKDQLKSQDTEGDLYMKMKDLESQMQMLQIQEDYLKDEQRHLKSEYVRSKEEVSIIDLYMIWLEWSINQKI